MIEYSVAPTGAEYLQFLPLHKTTIKSEIQTDHLIYSPNESKEFHQ